VKIYKDSCDLKLSYNDAPRTYYLDKDGDGYGNPLKTIVGLTQPLGYVDNNGDCKDGNAAINPGAADICNGIDDNCNGVKDENGITATITPSGNISACNGATLILTGGSGSGISYQWCKNGSVITGATNQIYSAKNTASYYVNTANTVGCTAISPSVNLTFLDTSSASITPLGNLNICQSGSVDLKANSGVNLTYQWIKGTDLIAGITNQTYTVNAKGNYKVIVTNNSGCSKTSKATCVTKSCKESVESNDNSSSKLNCFPNPSNGQFTLDLKMNQPFSGSATIEIVNLLNQRVYSEKVLIANGELKKIIEASYFIDGLYLLKIVAGDSSFSMLLRIQQ
jgi:hypothetical protein